MDPRRTFFLLLVCAASTYAQDLKAGYSKVDITPTEPVVLGGYNLRDAPSDGIHGQDKLYVRALIFEARAIRVAFVEADVIGIRQHDEWRRRISEATGIPVANILLGDVHNHAAPSPSPKLETPWERHFDRSILLAVRQALATLEPVRIGAGAGISRVGVNRRRTIPADFDSTLTFDENARSQLFGKHKTDKPQLIREFGGVVRLGANPGGPMDEAVQVVRIDSASGKPLAVMVHYGCHGTSLGGRNSKVSGEWMGRMQEYVERQFPGVGSIYLQGAAGDINPRVVGGLDGYQDNVETTWALGEEIGREVCRVYGAINPLPATGAQLQIEEAEILLPRSYRELFTDFRKTAVPVPTMAVRLRDLMWTTFPGEMFSNIGKQVKAASPATFAHMMGYANGSIGYFAEAEDFAEGGYEVATSHLDPSAHSVYLRAIKALMTRFH